MTDREIQALCKHLKVPKFMCDTQDSRNVLAQIYAAGQAQAARRCADIVGSVNNYDNPMTAGDCVDAIRALPVGE